MIQGLGNSSEPIREREEGGTKQLCFVDRDLAGAEPCGELFDEGAEISGFRPILSDISLYCFCLRFLASILSCLHSSRSAASPLKEASQLIKEFRRASAFVFNT